MPFANPVGGVIVQTGTDTDLSGLSGVTGVTNTSLTHLEIYDLGTNRLRIDGTLTINGASTADREMLALGVDGATQNVDIDLFGTLNIGSLDSQGGVEFNQEQFWPSIYEDANIDFGEGNGNISADGGTSDAFMNVEPGATLNWYGCINCTGGIRFKGVRDGSSGSDSNITIRGGVLDARRLTERGSGESDQFIYTYTDALDIAPPNGDTVGLTILTATTTGANEKGYAIIQLGQPTNLSGYRPVFSSQALGGSNSASLDLSYTVTNYTGIIGTSGTDNIDLRSASIASNTSVITFLNSIRGSLLNLATQDPGFSEIQARQTVTGTLVDSVGVDRVDAVLATQNVSGAITQDAITAGAFDLGNILLTSWDDSNPPSPTFNNPSNTDDDLWSFYVYSYLGVDRNRIDVRLRGVNGTDIEFIAPDDVSVTDLSISSVNSYPDTRDLNRLFDRQKAHKITNVGQPTYDTPIAVASGQAIVFSGQDIVVDGTASAWDYNDATTPDTITINPTTGANLRRIGSTSVVVDTPESTSITVPFPAGIADDDVAYLLAVHTEADSNNYTAPAGWVEIQGEIQVGGSPTTPPGLNVYRRVLSSDSGNVVISGNFTGKHVAQMIVYRDADTTTPEDVTLVTSTAVSGDVDPPSITTANDNAMILAIGVTDTDQTLLSGPSGYANVLTSTTPNPASGNQTFTTAGVSTPFVVPAGVTNLTNVKLWGAGGGGGGGGTAITGETGGGGGFVHITDLSVTPGETLNMFVGAGGAQGTAAAAAAEGGGGGGSTRVQRATGSVNLLEAGAGGGGGGGDNSGGAAATGRGGAGGGSTGETGVGSSTATGGGGGTQIAGGAGGVGNDQTGTVGSANTGGIGASDTGNGGGGAGGAIGGGAGGASSGGFGAGGGGGAGLFGGGGGGEAIASVGSGTGGGGGSNQISGTQVSNSQGSVSTGAGQGDADYPASTGDGGSGGATSGDGTAGQRGAIYVEWGAAGGNDDGALLATAEFKTTTAGAENPGVFDVSDNGLPWVSATLAIRELVSGGGSNLDPTTKFNRVDTSGAVTVQNGATIDDLTIGTDVFIASVTDLTNVIINGNLFFNVAGTYNFSNVTVLGDILNDDGTGNVVINASNGSVLSTSEPGTGNGEVNIINTVTVRVTARNASNSLPILGARVFVQAEAGGPLSAGTQILNTLTNASGVAEDIAFNFVSDQPISGRIRKGSASTFFKTAPLSGTITNAGLDVTGFLVVDE